MGVSVYSGVRVSGGTVTVHTGAGWLLAVLVSHAQTSAQTVELRDGTSGGAPLLMQLSVKPSNDNPYYVEFLHPVSFSSGLTVVAPTGVEVYVWAKGR